MSAETDVALMMELEGKINQRIKDVLYESVIGNTPTVPSTTANIQYAIAQGVKNSLLNDTGFVTELARRIGHKMQNIQY
jgi:hypothetical protein